MRSSHTNASELRKRGSCRQLIVTPQGNAALASPAVAIECIMAHTVSVAPSSVALRDQGLEYAPIQIPFVVTSTVRQKANHFLLRLR
jgi:hypothetical protein